MIRALKRKPCRVRAVDGAGVRKRVLHKWLGKDSGERKFKPRFGRSAVTGGETISGSTS